MFASTASLAIPGGPSLGRSNGLAVAEAVLALNAVPDNFGKPGGVYLSALAPNETEYHRPASTQEMQEFVQKMADGKFKVLFIHGVNPVFELPRSIDFKAALSGVEQVISFATFPDETALEADYVFPVRAVAALRQPRPQLRARRQRTGVAASRREARR